MEIKLKKSTAKQALKALKSTLIWSLVLTLLLVFKVPEQLGRLIVWIEKDAFDAASGQDYIHFVAAVVGLMVSLTILGLHTRSIKHAVEAVFTLPGLPRWLGRCLRLALDLWLFSGVLNLGFFPEAAASPRMTEAGLAINEALWLYLIPHSDVKEVVLNMIPTIAEISKTAALVCAVITGIILIVALFKSGIRKRKKRGHRARRCRIGFNSISKKAVRDANARFNNYRSAHVVAENDFYIRIKHENPAGILRPDQLHHKFERGRLHIRLEHCELEFTLRNGRAWLLGSQQIELLPGSPYVVKADINGRQCRQFSITFIKGGISHD